MRRTAAGIALLGLWCAVAPAEPFRYQRVAFPELLRAQVDASLTLARLPLVAEGEPLATAAVLVTATADQLSVDGAPLLTLSAGRVSSDAVGRCPTGLACVPMLRAKIASTRAMLASEPGTRPQVLLIVDANLPFATLLLLGRTAAEAGASLSTRLVARTERGALVGIPVLIAPARQLVVGRAQEPALITVDVQGPRLTVHATRTYLEQAVSARSRSELQQILGRLELASGRTACFVTASGDSTTAQVVQAIDSARQIFPHIVLTDRRGVQVVGQ